MTAFSVQPTAISTPGPQLRLPVVVVLGPTASGKTALAIQIALALDGEIISLDSLQIYRNAPILTAAPSESEQAQVPHHMVRYLRTDEEPTSYLADFFRHVSDIQDRGRLVVVCGGSVSLSMPVLEGLIAEGHRVHALLLYSSEQIMVQRINKRAEAMASSGMLDEILELRKLELQTGRDMRGKGIWKTIGYEELRDWADAVLGRADETHTRELLERGLERIKESTKRYGLMQIDHFRGKIFASLLSRGVHLAVFAVPAPDNDLDFTLGVAQPAVTWIATQTGSAGWQYTAKARPTKLGMVAGWGGGEPIHLTSQELGSF